MCRKLLVHLRIGEGPHLFYRSLLDLGTDAEVRDSNCQKVSNDLFFPKEASELTAADVRNIVLAGHQASKYNGRRAKFRKSQVKTGKISLIRWDLETNQYSASYSKGRLNIYRDKNLVISTTKETDALGQFPIHLDSIQSRIKTILTALQGPSGAHIKPMVVRTE